MRHRHLALALLAACAAPALANDTPLTLDQAMAHPDWIGPPVEQAWWSLDGQHALYTLKREGSPVRDTWTLPVAGGTPARVEGAALAEVDGARVDFDASGRRAVFVRNGDVFLREVGGALQQLTRSAEAEANARFAANNRDVVWSVGNDWFRWSPESRLAQPAALPRAEKDPAAAPEADALRDHQLRLSSTLAREKAQREALRDNAEALRRADPTRAAAPVYLGDKVEISSSVMSPDGRWLLVVTQAKGAEAGRTGKMPKYVTESGYEEFEDVRVRVGRNAPIAQQLKLVDLRDSRVRDLPLAALPGIGTDPLADLRRTAGLDPLKGERAVRLDAIEWSDDGRGVAVMARAIDNKDRWIATVDFEAGALQPLHRLTDTAWINWNFNDFGWLPDNRTVWFLSEESGWSHLYTATPGGRAKALTRGKWEASSPQWTLDGATAYFVCNRARPGDYEVCAVPRDGGDVREVTALDGVEDFSLSPDGRQLLVRWSAHHTPPQLAVQPVAGGEARKLTDTRSEDFKSRTWLAPTTVEVPSTHGAGKVWAKLYRPATLEAGRKYPVVMFVHGAGYLQNVSDRYPNYFREQMFHQLLVERGFLVLDMDFRASEGYGRDWRTAIYRQMGHPELEDYVDGVKYMVAQHQGDAANVGIYGGSYGGFMTFMALFREPDTFKAGAALRPVTDWTSYNHEYTSNILNTPELDPEAFRKSSPIEYVENLRGHLLISHGMIDDNVFYQDSVRMAQRLIELKKHDWEMASYPLERHGYQHPESWYDQYRRIFELFEDNLK
ncbi:MAG TPA: S9 family peptidase [Arenimonas sp.]|uniref:S9 family peptidase n=1 Tax=Arenimonas sp. TaxID=1872635 RepID=UPI002D7EA986|nr:S9 family peptidase [Arenimonas sp.]HEU0153917.1 S9 family peptidase [Arenimonas sp.]